ncbi:MAG: xanthine dehydrogenase accessory protein XdhC [Elusimicrobia bacterium]|nr:xanthine dehydrogenase accessory protein XdhC [Elusimicrobiota bacterium]
MRTSKNIGDFMKDLPRPGVLCTIVRIVGSAPREVGAKMWVTGGDFLGTVGGGEFERRVLEHARGLLGADRKEPHLKEYVLCREMGQCCGGRVEVFFEIAARERTVHLFGAGHVGRAVAEVLSGMPVRVAVVDSRSDWAKPEEFPSDVKVVCADPIEHSRGSAWGASDAVCIFTHSHGLDFELTRYFLGRPVGYLGLIGSEHKARVFQTRLMSLASGEEEKSKVEELWEERMRCPMGISLPGKNPKVIAVSIAAELLRDWGLPKPAEEAREHGASGYTMFPAIGKQDAAGLVPVENVAEELIE